MVNQRCNDVSWHAKIVKVEDLIRADVEDLSRVGDVCRKNIFTHSRLHELDDFSERGRQFELRWRHNFRQDVRFRGRDGCICCRCDRRRKISNFRWFVCDDDGAGWHDSGDGRNWCSSGGWLAICRSDNNHGGHRWDHRDFPGVGFLTLASHTEQQTQRGYSESDSGKKSFHNIRLFTNHTSIASDCFELEVSCTIDRLKQFAHYSSSDGNASRSETSQCSLNSLNKSS